MAVERSHCSEEKEQMFEFGRTLKSMDLECT